MNTSAIKLDSFTRAYVECALWSSMDNSDESGGESLDANYGVEDIAPEALASMAADCDVFQRACAPWLQASTLSDEQAGHDFWLTRNGHGAGFWDRRHISKAADQALDQLTEECRAWGSVDLYVGDDGRIYL